MAQGIGGGDKFLFFGFVAWLRRRRRWSWQTLSMLGWKAVRVERGGEDAQRGVEFAAGFIMGVALLEHQAGRGQARHENGKIGQGKGLAGDEHAEMRHAGLAAIELERLPDHGIAGLSRVIADGAGRLLEAHDIGHRGHIDQQAVVGADAALAEIGGKAHEVSPGWRDKDRGGGGEGDKWGANSAAGAWR